MKLREGGRGNIPRPPAAKVLLLLGLLGLFAILDHAIGLALALFVLGVSLLGGSDASLCVWELLPFNHWHCYFPFFFFDFPAEERAIAIACFRGFPALSSLLMFSEITS